MKKLDLLCGCAIALVSSPAAAQTAGTMSAQNAVPSDGPGQDATTAESMREATYGEDIVVTAQRQSQRLQDVPIAVCAFTAESAREAADRESASDLQLSLPNVTFTKTNFTSSSFTIRGIGDLCVGVTCDSATAIHVNDMPLLGTRLFETEFFDLERVEVLRGPQGTLFGRNATSGVVNFITAQPDLSAIPRRGRGRIRQLRFEACHAAWSTCRSATRSASGSRAIYLNRDGYHQEPVRRQPGSTAATSMRFAARCAGSRPPTPGRPDRLLFPRERRSRAHPEAAVPPRPDRHARLPARPARLRVTPTATATLRRRVLDLARSSSATAGAARPRFARWPRQPLRPGCLWRRRSTRPTCASVNSTSTRPISPKKSNIRRSSTHDFGTSVART